MLFIISAIVYSCCCNNCVILKKSEIYRILQSKWDILSRIRRRREQCVPSWFLKTKQWVKKRKCLLYWFYRIILVKRDNVVHFGRKLYFLSQIFQIPLPYSASSFFVNYIKCCIQAFLNWQPAMNFIDIPKGSRIPVYLRFLL